MNLKNSPEYKSSSTKLYGLDVTSVNKSKSDVWEYGVKYPTISILAFSSKRIFF